MPSDGGGTLGALMKWWIDGHAGNKHSLKHVTSSIKVHVLSSDIAGLPLTAVTSEKVEALLKQKGQEELSPKYINHLRGYLAAAFSAAIRVGYYPGKNPIERVQKLHVPTREPSYLKAREVLLVLDEVDSELQPLFALAIYGGLRKGELLALKKEDVDLDARLVKVARSGESSTTKGKREKSVPIAAELLPYLKRAMDTSPSALMFPKPDGSMMRRDVSFQRILRNAMGRAGIVTGYGTYAGGRVANILRSRPTRLLAAAPPTGPCCGRSRRSAPPGFMTYAVEAEARAHAVGDEKDGSFVPPLSRGDENAAAAFEESSPNPLSFSGKISGPSRIRTWDQSVMSRQL